MRKLLRRELSGTLTHKNGASLRRFRRLQILFSCCAKLKDFARADVTRVTSYGERRILAPERRLLRVRAAKFCSRLRG